MDTRQQLLLCAETLIARQGPGGFSLREAGRMAGQRNPAALQYHFGDRDRLIQEWLAWRMRQVNRLRDQYYPAEPADSRALVERLAKPFMRLLEENLARDPQSGCMRCLAQLEAAGKTSLPRATAGARWNNSLASTLESLRVLLPADHADWQMRLLLATLSSGLALLEKGCCEGSITTGDLPRHEAWLLDSLVNMLAPATSGGTAPHPKT